MWLWLLTRLIITTRRYGPLRGPTSSFAEGFGRGFFCPSGKQKKLIMLFWPIFGNFWCPVVNLVTFGSNPSNFERNSKKPKIKKKNIKISKSPKIKKINKKHLKIAFFSKKKKKKNNKFFFGGGGGAPEPLSKKYTLFSLILFVVTSQNVPYNIVVSIHKKLNISHYILIVAYYTFMYTFFIFINSLMSIKEGENECEIRPISLSKGSAYSLVFESTF